MSAPRRIDALDVPESTLLELLRLSLPLTDPDRHALDVVADAQFAALAPGRPDLTASRAAGFEEKSLDWGKQPERRRPDDYSPDCQPEFTTPKPLSGAQDVQTGGVL